MAPDQGHPITERGIYRVLKSRVQDGLNSEQTEFELRTVQNINSGGYFNPVRQGNVVKFTKAFCKAFTRLKRELSADYNVNVNGIWASNGEYAASKVLPQLDRGLVDKGLPVDARAWKSDVKKLYFAVGDNLAIINTAGGPSARFRRYNIPFWHLNERMVAYHNKAKAFKGELPGLKVYWMDPKGANLWYNPVSDAHFQHIRPPQCDNPCLVKEFSGKGYTHLRKITGNELMSKIFTELASDRGEVFMAPEPEKAGKGGSEIKKKSLNPVLQKILSPGL